MSTADRPSELLTVEVRHDECVSAERPRLFACLRDEVFHPRRSPGFFGAVRRWIRRTIIITPVFVIGALWLLSHMEQRPTWGFHSRWITLTRTGEPWMIEFHSTDLVSRMARLHAKKGYLQFMWGSLSKSWNRLPDPAFQFAGFSLGYEGQPRSPGGSAAAQWTAMVGPATRQGGWYIASPIRVLLAAAIILSSLVALLRPATRARRRSRGRCVECAYSLTGLTEPRCPECGTPIPSDVGKSVEKVQFAASEVVAGDDRDANR